MKHTYVEILRFDTDEVVHRVDVTGRSDRTIERVERGMNINLNRDEFYTETKAYDEPQPLNP
jgi:hypothetical protein